MIAHSLLNYSMNTVQASQICRLSGVRRLYTSYCTLCLFSSRGTEVTDDGGIQREGGNKGEKALEGEMTECMGEDNCIKDAPEDVFLCQENVKSGDDPRGGNVY